MKINVEQVLRVNGSNVIQLTTALREAKGDPEAVLVEQVQDFLHMLAMKNILIAASYDTPAKPKKERKPRAKKSPQDVASQDAE